MSVLAQHRFSVKDYYRMAETGVLCPDARVELLEGRIIDMSPIGSSHAGTVKRLIRIFSKTGDDRWTISVQDPLHLDDHSEPEPDVMLLKPSADDYVSRHPEPDKVFLLIEVSDVSLDYDREEKLPVYGRAGIPEVWIVNLNEAAVEVYREPNFTGYGTKNVCRTGQQISPLSFPDILIDVTGLLKR